MLKLQIIVGSTRQGRNADHLLKWIEPAVKAHSAFETEILDLREWPLPFFQEVVANMGDLANPKYSDPLVTRWNAKIKEGEAYLIVTPEYNHGLPAVLKNAIDTIFFSNAFRHKPFGVASYSIGVTGGVRAVEQLNQVMLETEAVPVRYPVIVPLVTAAFTAEAKPANPIMDVALSVTLDELAWLGGALQKARAAGEPPPASARMRAAAGRK